MTDICLDIALSRWAVIQYSAYIWKRPTFREHLVRTATAPFTAIYIMETIPPKLHEELDKLILPPNLKKELKFAIGSIGTEIQKWLRHIAYLNESNTGIDFSTVVNNIHWNHIGCIDYAQSITSIYKLGFLRINHRVWMDLCLYCVEECLIDVSEKISNNSEHYDLLTEIDDDRHPHVLSNYWRHHLQTNSRELTDGALVFILKTMWKTREGLIYFWQRITDDERKKFLHYIAAACSKADNWFEQIFKSNVGVLMFIMQQLSMYGCEEIIMQMSKSFWLLTRLSFWPLQIGRILLTQDVLTNDGPDKFLTFMIEILDLMRYERAYVGDDSETRKLFYIAWDNSILHEDNLPHAEQEILIRNTISWEDLESLKYLITHQKSWKDTKALLNDVVVSEYRSYELTKMVISELSQHEVSIGEWWKKRNESS